MPTSEIETKVEEREPAVIGSKMAVEFPDGPDHGTVVRALNVDDLPYYVVQFDRQGRALVSPVVADAYDDLPEGTPAVIVCNPNDVGVTDEQTHKWEGAMLRVLD